MRKRNKLKKCNCFYFITFVFFLACKEETKSISYKFNQFDNFSSKILSESEVIENINYTNYIGELQYNEYCKEIDLHINRDYVIVQSKVLLDSISTTKRMSYEVVYFFDSNSVPKLINYVENNKCVEDFNLKINKIYKVDDNTIIIANCLFGYDILKFERLIKSTIGEVKAYNIKHP